jgi:hypothetical protein
LRGRGCVLPHASSCSDTHGLALPLTVFCSCRKRL